MSNASDILSESVNIITELPFNWTKRNLFELCNPRQWRTISQDEMTKTGYPVFGANGFIGYYPEYNHENETIAITCRGATCGTVNLVPKKVYITGNSMCLDNVSRDIDVKYLYYASSYRTLSDIICGSAQPQITGESLRLIILPTPPLLEQKKIASILTSVDDVIDNTQQQIDKLQDLKKATMNELLTKGIGHTEFKDSALGRIPKSWEVCDLGTIGSFSKGKGISKEEACLEGIPCIRYAEIYTEYDFVIENFKSFILPELVNTTKKLKTNDIIFAGSGETVEDIGKSVAFVSDCEAYVGGDSIIFSPKIDCNSVFLSYQLNDNLRRKQLRKLAQGGSVIHVYTSGIKQLKIALPNISEQNHITEILRSHSNAVNIKKQKIEQIKSLKKSLMQALLTGKVRVKLN